MGCLVDVRIKGDKEKTEKGIKATGKKTNVCSWKVVSAGFEMDKTVGWLEAAIHSAFHFPEPSMIFCLLSPTPSSIRHFLSCSLNV